VSKHSGEVANYLGKLSSTLSKICGGYSNISRFKTANRMNALCVAIQQTRKPLDLFETMRSAKMETSPAGMGVVFKQASAIHQALDQVRIEVFERLGQVQDEPRASVAQGLRRQIQEALEADEHVTSLDGVVRRWLDDAMKVLLDRPAPPAQPPQPPPTQPEPPIVTPPPVQPGQKVLTGSRRASGLGGWKSITEEIERELTEDAELEISWRIVKKSE
jgi:hypothetical protein